MPAELSPDFSFVKFHNIYEMFNCQFCLRKNKGSVNYDIKYIDIVIRVMWFDRFN